MYDVNINVPPRARDLQKPASIGENRIFEPVSVSTYRDTGYKQRVMA